MFNKYYQDELAYLREMGREYAAYKPESAGWLAEPGTDPDVERLLEGFAFLTGRIREKLDDELPEFTHALVQLFWPHYLRPIPAATIMQFQAKAKAGGKVNQIPRGTEVCSAPIDGTRCVFRTTADMDLVPLEVSEVEIGPPNSPFVRVVLQLGRGASLAKLGLKQLRFYLAGESTVTRALYLALTRYLKRVKLRSASNRDGLVLDRVQVQGAGFIEEEALLPLAEFSFPGFRLLHEYFAFPAKFMFVDVLNLEQLSSLGDNRFELLFELTSLPRDMPPVTTANIQLNCVPAINLLPHDADPIAVEHKRTEYKLQPAGKDKSHHEIYSIETVKGLRRGQPEPRVYTPFFSFFRPENEQDSLFYKARTTNAQTTSGTEVFVTFLGSNSPDSLNEQETISVELICSNRHLPNSLGLGGLNQSRPSSPSFASFKNIVPPTPAVPPPLSGELYWSLLSHLSLNYLSLLKPERLRQVIKLYDFRARVNRQAHQSLQQKLEGILAVRAQPETQLYRGAMVRGLGVELDIDEDKFGGEGEGYLFGAVMKEFLAHYVGLNSFTKLTVRARKNGEIHTWPARSGKQELL